MSDKINKLKEQLKDTTFLIGVRKRRSAANELGKIGTAPVVMPLVDALGDEDQEVKRNAFQSLSKLSDPTAQEVLRNIYLKTKKKALWQIIKKNRMYPHELSKRFAFFTLIKAKDEILNLVNEGNFEEIVDMILESDMDNPSSAIMMILEKGGEQVEMNIIKKFMHASAEARTRRLEREKEEEEARKKAKEAIEEAKKEKEEREKNKPVIDPLAAELNLTEIDGVPIPPPEEDDDEEEEEAEVEIPEFEEVPLSVEEIFRDRQADALFEVIDNKEWYPPELDKKLMFLLKTERYKKVIDMLDGADFRQVLDILVDPKFPMKKSAIDCLKYATNPIIIDEICQVFIREGNPHLGHMIIQNNWAPNSPRDRIFFYLKTDFLQGFFASIKMDSKKLAGYLEIIHIRKALSNEDYTPLATFLSSVAGALAKSERPDLKTDNPLAEMLIRMNEYIEHKKSPEIINEICKDYMENPSPYLEYFLKEMKWAPEETEDKVLFYIQSDQPKMLKRLNDKAVEPLYELMKGMEGKEQFKEKAKELMKDFKNPDAIDKIFGLYFKTLDQELIDIITENDWKPSNTKERALYYIYSGQPDRYAEIEPDGYDLIFEAYKSLDTVQRFKLVEILIKSKAERFSSFLLNLFEYEKNPRVLKLLTNIITVFFADVYKPMKDLVKKLEGTALREIIKTLTVLATAGSSEMLYYIARVKKGYTAFWILKLLEDVRYQPNNRHERDFLYELYNLRDEMTRILQNRIVDEDPEIRAHSAYLFSDLGDEKYLTTLMKYVEDPIDEVRAAIAYSIGYLCALSPENALKQIESFRVGSIYMIFNDVRKAFMVQSDIEQIQILSKNYEHGNLVLRIFAIAALEGLQKREGLRTLLKALDDESKLVVKSALRALIDISDRDAHDELYKRLEEEDHELRMLIAKALGNIADEKTCDKMTRKINSGEFSHIDGMLYVLSAVDPARNLKLFERVISRPDFPLRAKGQAVIAMAKTGDEEAAKQLVQNFRSISQISGKPEEIIPYIQAFGIIGKAYVYKSIESVMKSGNWQIRAECLEAMGNIPERIALVSIIKALEDNNGWVQWAALKSLSKYFNNHFKFQHTEKDLQFIAAIIGRLKKFHLQEIIDKEAVEIKILAQLEVKLMKNELTRMYFTYKQQLEGNKS